VYGDVPPAALTVQLKGLPVVATEFGEPQVTVTTKGCEPTLTTADPTVDTPFESETWNDSVRVPLTGSAIVKLPMPEYGAVPPVADTVHPNGFPAVTPTEGHETLATRGCGDTVTLVDPDATAPLASVTLNTSEKTPFADSVTGNVPVLEYGVVPPVAETTQLNGFPEIKPLLGHDTVTTSGWPATVTLAVAVAVTPFASVTLNVSVFVPLVLSVRLKSPIPWYGPVSPVAATVQLKGLPTVTPDTGHEAFTTRGVP